MRALAVRRIEAQQIRLPLAHHLGNVRFVETRAEPDFRAG
jgi:hypothetical protein